jgi:hypothetical protein
MNRNSLPMSLVFTGLLLAAIPVLAHHSVSAEFDSTKPIEFTGTVKTVEWTSPHIYTQVEVKQPDGTTKVYRVEGGAPNSLFRNGWRKDSLKIGQVVSVKGHRAKNVSSPNVGTAAITTQDGKRVFAAQAE